MSPEEQRRGPPDDAARLDLIQTLLQEEATWAQAPPEVLEALMAEIGAGQGPVSTPKERRMRIRWPAIAAGAAGAAVLALLFFGPLGESEPVPDAIVAVTATDRAPSVEGTAAVRATSSGWWIRLDVTGLPPAAEGSYYQGWVRNDGSAVSIGTFHMRDGGDPVVLWSGVSLVDYPTLMVTLQDEDAGPEFSEQVMLWALIEGISED